jgi:hypothetical protein
VKANRGVPAALQVGLFTGAPANNNQWHMTDPLLQLLLPGLLSDTIAAMQSEATINGAPLPLIIGEFGANYPGDIANATEQGAYFNLTFNAAGGSLQSMGLGNIAWDISEGNQGGANFSIIDNSGNILPAGCVVAKAHGAKPAGC